jgi:tetratricopeptide (TPR) repeat protein
MPTVAAPSNSAPIQKDQNLAQNNSVPNDVEQILKVAVEHHQAGQLDAAAQGYAQILASDPNHGDALHLAGCVRYQQHDPEAGIGLIRQAIGVNPGLAVAHDNLGLILRDRGDLASAEASHRRAAAAKPNHPDAHNHLGVALFRQQRVPEAIECYRRAIQLKPDHAEAHNNLGTALQALGNLEEAAESHRRAVAARPDYVEAHNNLALALSRLGRSAEAAESLRRALEVRPNYAAALVNLGNLQRDQGDFDGAIDWYHKAIAADFRLVDAHIGLAFALQQRGRLADAAESYRQALELKPDQTDALCNLGALLNGFDRHEEAVESYRRVLARNPDHVAALCNMGVALMARNQVDGAVECYRHAIAVSPDFADAHWNLSLAQLVEGDFANGWRGYEWRLRTKRHQPRAFTQPMWDGAPLAGKTILLHREQGLGDTIQFMRYAPLVAARGGRVVLEVQPPLTRLAASLEGVTEIVAGGAPLPHFDLHCPLMSLPERFGTSLATIPAAIPYLAPDPEAVERWRPKLGGGQLHKVGIAWAGNRLHKNDRSRSVALERLLPILEIPGIRWVSLQVGEHSGDLVALPIGMVADLSGELGDFADTAAVIANLDLVIAVDTAVVHLAGALGRPVWAMLPFAPDWRWLLDREDSPWYPSLRLFRQARPGDWESLLVEIRQALGERTSQVLPEWRPDPATGKAETPVPGVDSQLVFDAALAHHGAGRLDAAEAAAHEAIAHHPAHAGAHHLLGIITIQRGDHQKAIDLLNQSIRLDPTAEQAYNNRGIALSGLGRADEAIASLRKATELNPGFAVAHYNLGSVLQRANRLDEAADSLRQAITAKPDYFDAHFHLGNALYQLRQFEAAEASYQNAVELRPDVAVAHFGLASALKALQRNDEAIAVYRRAVELKPDWPEAHNSLGNALIAQSHDDEGIASFERALALKPDYADAHNNLGVALQKQNRIAGALLSYHRCELLRPDHADLHLNMALAYLVAGDFANGWREYEWRYQSKARPPRKLAQPLWTGEDLAGKTILLHHEQGFGDTLQFMRFAPLVAAKGARVLLEVQPALARLTATLKGPSQVVAAGEALPPFDFHCPLLSVPERFGTDLASIPATAPYLTADTKAVRRWRREIGDAPGLKIGLVWAGNAKHQNESQRSVDLRRLLPLLELPGIRWFSLQVGERAADLAELPAAKIVDLSKGLTDFAETAAAMANLDLVVAVDTSVVHLAGALGRPVWAMLAFAPDWRWLLGREDSPWYPSVRLFRQPRTGDWESVVARVSRALTLRAAEVAAGAPAPALIDPAAEYGTAMEHYAAGRLGQAEIAAKAILEVDPDHAGALHLAGIAEIARGNHRRAAELLQRSATIVPDDARTQNNLGIALSSLGKAEEATQCFGRAVALDPNLADAHANLGRLLMDRKKLDEAIASFRRAAALKPDDATVIGKLGMAQYAQDRLDDADASFRRALALDPNMAEAANYLGLICRAERRLTEATEHYRRAIAYRPDFAAAHFNLGFAQLALGDFTNGWREYEWRWQMGTSPLRKLAQPLWTGQDLRGKTILLHHEQGLGDTIQFLRYAPLVAAKGAGVVLEVQPAMVRLAAGFTGEMEVVGAGDPLPPFEYHCPLLSLPERFATDLASIPAPIPYLVPEPEAVARWRRELAPESEMKIGVVWAGNPVHPDDRNRSLPLERLAPLLEIPSVRWFSLQVGERAADIAGLPGGPITDLSRRLKDLAETAAAIVNLDLVIAVDTAVVHLAGALGRPTWVLLPFAPDWRWMFDRDDSPWYPSLRLFRQQRRGEWDAVVAHVRTALVREIAARERVGHEAPPPDKVLA